MGNGIFFAVLDFCLEVARPSIVADVVMVEVHWYLEFDYLESFKTCEGIIILQHSIIDCNKVHESRFSEFWSSRLIFEGKGCLM